ncbi:ZIP family metal transporter [Allohahella sp. A8]|uniref:ZIP family metal transporter n=1 Tax=Allohahella sp. A8 TaxID=3141461 RepID=UPI00269881D7
MDIWTVLGLALLPALGNFAGGLLAEFTATPKNRLNNALHGAAGIVIAVVAVEIMPEALKKTSSLVIALGFGLGGLAYLLIQGGVRKLQGRFGKQTESNLSMWMVYVAVSVDLFSDGLLVGTGSTISLSMAVVLALGQVLADGPEGYATVANMKANGIPRLKRTLLSATLVVPALGAAAFSFYLLRDQSQTLQMGMLTFTAAILTVAAVEDMLSEAHESADDTRYSVLAFTGGFVLFTLVSAGLGS